MFTDAARRCDLVLDPYREIQTIIRLALDMERLPSDIHCNVTQWVESGWVVKCPLMHFKIIWDMQMTAKIQSDRKWQNDCPFEIDDTAIGFSCWRFEPIRWTSRTVNSQSFDWTIKRDNRNDYCSRTEFEAFNVRTDTVWVIFSE
jgi:hypothetical protein